MVMIQWLMISTIILISTASTSGVSATNSVCSEIYQNFSRHYREDFEDIIRFGRWPQTFHRFNLNGICRIVNKRYEECSRLLIRRLFAFSFGGNFSVESDCIQLRRLIAAIEFGRVHCWAAKSHFIQTFYCMNQVHPTIEDATQLTRQCLWNAVLLQENIDEPENARWLYNHFEIASKQERCSILTNTMRCFYADLKSKCDQAVLYEIALKKYYLPNLMELYDCG